jgi:FAD/FMN-containing dehydrogenase
MTGLVGGACPRAQDVVLSLERLNVIQEIDPVGRTLTVQAGAILQTVQERVEEAGLVFPVDLGARGTATIGGMIATNAGGLQVLRYGMMRASVLGLEAVLADGTVVSSMSHVLKDNAGYDLKQLFIGTEGTLGVITRAVIRLLPKSGSMATMFASVDGFENLVELLRQLDSGRGGILTTFEVMWDNYYELLDRHCDSLRLPLPTGSQYYVLAECQSSDADSATGQLEAALEPCLESGVINDVVIAQSVAQRKQLWRIREDAGEGFRALRPLVTFDISIPIAVMEDFNQAIQKKIHSEYPDAAVIVLGHMADGNLHVVVGAGEGDTTIPGRVEELVYGEVARLQGSVSAEHGIGTLKKPYLAYSRNPAEVTLMRSLKQSLDPAGILNPGKVI